jgi:tRNA(Ile2) C34 agmatinyltransferase TiaS
MANETVQDLRAWALSVPPPARSWQQRLVLELIDKLSGHDAAPPAHKVKAVCPKCGAHMPGIVRSAGDWCQDCRDSAAKGVDLTIKKPDK